MHVCREGGRAISLAPKIGCAHDREIVIRELTLPGVRPRFRLQRPHTSPLLHICEIWGDWYRVISLILCKIKEILRIDIIVYYKLYLYDLSG